ncbi:diablo IAP-binding mitochondrial protein-like [Amblyomma americanum]
MLRLLWRFRHVRNIARVTRRYPEFARIGGKAAFATTAAWGLPVRARCLDDDSDTPTIDPESLSHEFLIKQASVIAVEAASRVLIQLTVAILDAHEEYCKSLHKLSSLINRFETEVGLCSGDDAFWMEMIAIRDETNRLKADVLSLESRMQSITSLVDAVAQAAFVNGAEYAGISANERLLSAERQLKSAAQKTATLEDAVNRAHRDAVLSSADKLEAPEEGERKEA